ncbi:type II toxin-antitoxin system PemK/MazF family toxin [Desulfobulbus sp.]|uniref:type II toxin-antitoxin system PemK/MazF family toxin n=1 Tax=Desulfobulbus sp. TaxID=895 RepID=UPI0027B9E310|nr:type II toxin-antitoxin system PemK/MazF family toxin [Desulfobulbus sp.]
MKQYIPKRGDIVWTDFDPTAGHEQKGKRPALVLSPEPFNKKMLLALVAPITSRVRGHAFEVSLQGQKVSGVVLCQQVKTIDFVERGVSFAERATDDVLSDVLAKFRAIIS